MGSVVNEISRSQRRKFARLISAVLRFVFIQFCLLLKGDISIPNSFLAFSVLPLI
jgi:hypothetical protein